MTLHITARCNFRCRYCYAAPHEGGDMSWETARAAVHLAIAATRREDAQASRGVIFFGGEPLLRRDLIRQVIDYCRAETRRSGQLFHFKLTTNGSLLDEDFLCDELTSEIFIALSHDGLLEAHDAHRVDANGMATYERLRSRIELLLRWKPYSPVMLVVTPETVHYYAGSVQHLFRCGFRYLICSLNYGAQWSPSSLDELERQYRQLSTWYEEQTRREEKFYFSPLDTKIAAHIFPGSCRRERCELGARRFRWRHRDGCFPAFNSLATVVHQLTRLGMCVAESTRRGVGLCLKKTMPRRNPAVNAPYGSAAITSAAV